MSHICRSSKCFYSVDEKVIEKEKKVPLDTSEIKCNLKNSDLSRKKFKNEVIDLTGVNNDGIKKEPIKQEIKSEKPNSEQIVPENNIEYIHKEWLIKQSDTESLENMLCRELQEIDSKNLIFSEYTFTCKIKYMQLGSYKFCENSTRNEFHFNNRDGIRLTLDENEYQVNIIIGSNDLNYCACIFYKPIYCLFIQIDKQVAEMYQKSFKVLPRLKNQNNIEDITRLVLILDMNNKDLKYLSNFLSNYIISIPPINHNRINFIKRSKAKRLMRSLFKSSKDKSEDATKSHRNSNQTIPESK
ncbi:unnamed protein product [Brachionus calyciflorus]|uniref:Uncharacterized protein n=1 Tax=Brachionus calyciflorus TaxID=104777 RepID=A0A814MJU5_9BILA|nr:unnamed protein product [Brachionus calyciflorus]